MTPPAPPPRAQTPPPDRLVPFDPPPMVPLPRRLLAELLGTATVAMVVVGSGIMAQRLSDDVAVQLIAHTVAVATGIGILIVALAPVSGAHFNPLISVADWAVSRRAQRRGVPAPGAVGLRGAHVVSYTIAQVIGAVGGALVTHAMFDLPLAQTSSHTRDGANLVLGEVVATAGLLLVVLALNRTGQTVTVAAVAVPAYIAAAIWFTSSACFINPAMTLARSLTDTFTGIAPHSVPGFVTGQVIGGALGVLTAFALYPDRRDVPPEPPTPEHG